MTRLFIVLALVGFTASFLCTPTAAQEKKIPPKITFDDHVKPIFRQKCASCHNPDKKKGDLDLTNYLGAMTGGGSGEVITAGDSSDSYLYELITHESEPLMPPESPKIPDAMIETIRKWIDGGVLENKGSVAAVVKKKKFDLALAAPSNERPATVPMPPHLSLKPVLTTPKPTTVSAMATSPWAPLLAIAGQKQILLYNTKTLAPAGVLPFPEGIAHILRFSRNGGLLLAGGGRGGAAGKVVVWNIRTGDRIIEVGDELDTVLSADISSDQSLIALGGPQKIVRIYETETGKLLHELRKHTDWIEAVEFSPDSVLLATGDRAGNLHVWEGVTGREYLTLKGHGKMISAVSWRSDSNVLASSSEDGTVRTWEMENGGQIKSWGAHGGGASWVEFTRDGRLVSSGRDRVTKIWQQDGKQVRAFEALGDLAVRTTHCDETNRVITGGWTGDVRVWNAADGKRIGGLTTNPQPLETRLAAATTLSEQRETQHAPKLAAYQSAQAVATKAQADLAAANSQMTGATKQAATTAANLTTTKTALDSATAVEGAITKQVATLASAVADLSVASTKAAAAAKLVPTDKELAAATATITALAAARATTLEAAKKDAAVKTATRVAATQAHTAATKADTTAKTALAAAGQAVAKTTPLVKPAVDKAAAAKQASDAATVALTAAKGEATRWQNEIAFAKQLETLSQQLSKAQAALLSTREQQALLDNTHSAATVAGAKAAKSLAAAKAELAKSQAASAKVIATITQTKTAMATATTEQTAMTGQQAILAEVIAALDSANKSAVVAAQKAGGKDSQLNSTVATIQVTLTAKQQSHAKGVAALAAKVKQITQLAAQLATAEKQSATLATAVTAAGKIVTDRTAPIAPLQAKTVATQKAKEAGTVILAASQKVVDDITTQINTAKGISL